jgi:hypothetical protein
MIGLSWLRRWSNQKYLLYMPVDKSSGADMFFFTQQMDSLHFQFKAAKEALCAAEVIDAAQKIFCKQDAKTTLVFAALKAHEEDISSAANQSSRITVENNWKPVALYLPPGSKLQKKRTSWKIPRNMDIVILLEAGVAQLLTTEILSLLKEGSKDFQKYLAPLRKRVSSLKKSHSL